MFSIYYEVVTERKNLIISVESQLDDIMDISELALRKSIWDFDLGDVEDYSDAISNNKNIAYVRVTENGVGDLYVNEKEGKEYESNYLVTKNRPITYKDREIGEVVISYTIYYENREIIEKIQGRLLFFIVIIGVLILVINYISSTLTKPLGVLSEATYKLADGDYTGEIEIVSNDEIGDLTKQFNQMARKIIESRRSLDKLNKELESKVSLRTLELNNKNENLIKTIRELKETKEQLIENSMMSLTSRLVAGVAHEINTPLGTAITTNSYLGTIIEDLSSAESNQAINRVEFKEMLEQMHETNSITEKNLVKSVELIESFKNLAIDHYDQSEREFSINDYINSIIFTFKKDIEIGNHLVNLDCPENLRIKSNPSAFLQIFSNLISNSLVHGFENMTKGRIDINIREEDNSLLIRYSDDGLGFKEDMVANIYEPFVSSKKNQGYSGLGMSILYNAVVYTLSGTIKYDREVKEGATFIIRIPIKI